MQKRDINSGGEEMASIENPSELTVDHLLQNVKKLSPVELDEFTQKLSEWKQQQYYSIDEDLDPDASDDEVLEFIRKNTRLSEKENRRYWELRGKSDDETLSDDELPEYQELVRKLTILNTKRIEGMTVLSKRWDKPVRQIMVDLGLVISHIDGFELANLRSALWKSGEYSPDVD